MRRSPDVLIFCYCHKDEVHEWTKIKLDWRDAEKISSTVFLLSPAVSQASICHWYIYIIQAPSSRNIIITSRRIQDNSHSEIWWHRAVNSDLISVSGVKMMLVLPLHWSYHRSQQISPDFSHRAIKLIIGRDNLDDHHHHVTICVPDPLPMHHISVPQ